MMYKGPKDYFVYVHVGKNKFKVVIPEEQCKIVAFDELSAILCSYADWLVGGGGLNSHFKKIIEHGREKRKEGL